MAMSEADMEKYAQMLDDLMEKDPAAYEQLIAMMKDQVAQATAGDSGAIPPPSPASMLDAIKNAAASPGASTTSFKPKFPGNKVMEKDGLSAKQEGIHIEVEPGFVMKSTDVRNQKKVFVNVCYSDQIQTFSQRKQLDSDGKEQEGVHVPLSLGAPHQVMDKSGNTAMAFDVAVNTQVIEDCKNDKTGSFRNFVCELAIEYIDQKYKIQLDPRYKLPKLAYRGELPPPKHYIRKVQKPIIEEVAAATVAPTQKKMVAKTHHAKYTIFESTGTTRVVCERVPAVDIQGVALSKELFAQCTATHLIASIQLESEVKANEVELEIRAEQMTVRALGHHDLMFYLPYPIDMDQAHVTLCHTLLEVKAPIDRAWLDHPHEPDVGSTPWLLIQALHDDEPKQTLNEQESTPKSLADMFHLVAPPVHSPSDFEVSTSKIKTTWDPVDEDEELPEDRFHQKDMMSMHILQQRKKEKEEKAREADAKRKAQRAENELKQQRAKEAGKTWREMYPNEPETTYIDMEDLVSKDKIKQHERRGPNQDVPLYQPTETAQLAAAAWTQKNKQEDDQGLDLASALAFELLD